MSIIPIIRADPGEEEEILDVAEPPELWVPEPCDPLRERIAQIGGRRIADYLAELATFGHPPLRVLYGRFASICGETENSLLVWFQPVGDSPAVRLFVRDPLGYAVEMTEEILAPAAWLNRVAVVADLVGENPYRELTEGEVMAISLTPVEDFGLGAEIVTSGDIFPSRHRLEGPLVEL